MSESTELKVKSFRISDETAEKIKNISYEIGGNQQQALSKLIEAYEFQKGKAVLTDKKADIEEFENYVSILTKKYMNVLEDNQNIKALVRTEFEAQLKANSETIIDLQAQLKSAKEVKEVATKKAKAMEEEVERLNQFNIEQEKEFLAKLDGLQDVLKEKENLNSVLTDSCNSFKVQVEQMKAEIAKAKEQEKELEGLQKKYNEILIISNNLQGDLENLQKEHDKAIIEMNQNQNDMLERVKLENEKSLLELEKKYQKEILELKEEFQKQKQAEVDKYQQKYFNLVEKLEKKRTHYNNSDKNKSNYKQNTNKNDILSQ